MPHWSSHFHDLSTTRYPALLAYATLLTGQRATAEDIVQDALLRTFGRPRRLPSVGHAEAYVRRAILTIFLDGTRRRSTLIKTFAKVAEAPVTPDSARDLENRDQVERALASLPPQVRAAIVLRYFDDLLVSEVAARMGITTGTAKRYLSDGIGRLRSVIAEPEPLAEDSQEFHVAVTIAAPVSRRRS